MKKCTKCGKEYYSGNFCPFCGTPFDTESPITEPLSDSSNTTKTSAPDGMYFNAYDSINAIPGKEVPIEDGKSDNKKMIRKILILICIVACFLIASSVLTPKLKVEPTTSTTATTTTTTTAAPTVMWQEYKFILNGVNMQLPMNYTEFQTNTGYTYIDKASKGTKISPGDVVPIVIGKNKSKITVYLRNNVGEAISPEKSVVVGIEADNNSNVSLSVGNIAIGTVTNVNNIQSTFGKFNESYTASNNFYSVTYYQNNVEDNNFEIHLSDGRVNYIHLIKGN